MKLVLSEKPKKPVIICGFPGFGFVGTIATEFLISHLNAKTIGYFSSMHLSPIAAIHQGKIIQPIELYYVKKNNIVIVHALTQVTGREWAISSAIEDLGKQLSAKEIICLEGIESINTSGNNLSAFVYSTNGRDKRIKVDRLNEGIIMGVSGAILLRVKSTPVTCIFAETHLSVPDSRAAAKTIETLDKYLGLKIPYEPLLKKAELFEEKIKGLLEKTQKVAEQKKKKEVYYMG
ncbi:proteasome assembly chaperone family protein [Candidatus Woesearchaeota archaeon]|nr:proteasome assembly chaperone family protein [Candidatus Woesearchaeota archaeon]